MRHFTSTYTTDCDKCGERIEAGQRYSTLAPAPGGSGLIQEYHLECAAVLTVGEIAAGLQYVFRVETMSET